jgi:hypothetical protein
MAAYPYPNSNSPLMWVVPKTGFSIQDIVEALFLPDGSYTAQELYQSPNLKYEFIDHSNTSFPDGSLWEDKDNPPYLGSSWRGYGCMYHNIAAAGIGYQSLHITHLFNGHQVLYEGEPPINSNAVYAEPVQFFRGQRYTRYAFLVLPGEFMNIFYNLRPGADNWNPIIAQCKFGVYDHLGNTLLLAEQTPELNHHGSDIYFFKYVQRNSANTGWVFGETVPYLLQGKSEIADNYSYWLYNPTATPRLYYIETTDYDVTSRSSVIFRMIKAPPAFSTGILYKNFRSFVYRVPLNENRSSLLQVVGGVSNSGGLLFKMEAFNAAHSKIGNVGLTFSGQTHNEWSHQSNLDRQYGFTTPSGCAYVIVYFRAPQIYSGGHTGCNYSFRII